MRLRLGSLGAIVGSSVVIAGALVACGEMSDETCADLKACEVAGGLDAGPTRDAAAGGDAASDRGPDAGGPTDGQADAPSGDGGLPGADADAGVADSALPDTAPTCDVTKTPAEDPCVVDEAYGVFVAPAPMGNDANAGTKGAPVATLVHAVEVAKLGSLKRVFACAATFTDALVLRAAHDIGVSIFGGLACPDGDAGPDAGAAWLHGSQPTVVAPAMAGHALRLEGLAQAIRIEDVSFVAKDATAKGESSIAAFVSGSASVRFVRGGLTAGAGQDGGAGATPTTALPVSANGSDGTSGGAETKCTCGAAQTVGGAGGKNNGNGSAGTPNDGAGAAGDSSLACSKGGNGGTGGDAPVVAASAGASAFGALTSSGWAPAGGVAGEQGAPGQGGGGGASEDATATGGGGACGGCGGAGASAGSGGGSSVALLVLDSAVTIAGSRLTAHAAGDGGSGAAGQGGAAGGTHGGPTGAACNGGDGGHGAQGGASGGGAGGVSVGALYHGAVAPSVDAVTTIVLGAAGAGGAGASPGKAGVAVKTLAVP